MSFVWAVIMYAWVLALTLLKQYLKFYTIIQQTIKQVQCISIVYWHSWTSNCVCKYQMFKKNRTSRVLSGQVPFFQITSPGTSTPLCFIFDVYVKSTEIPEHRYSPDQSRPIRENNPYMADFVPYWPCCSIYIIIAVFIISSTII
jgi:hypothetical protein